MSLSKQDLINYFVAGCKPVGHCQIGTENEVFAYHQKGWRRAGYSHGILPIFQKLIHEEKWEPVCEGEIIIALQKNGKAITLEPGGQFELSGGVFPDLHQTKHELDDHIAMLQRLSKDMDIAFVPVGFEPLWSREEIGWMPKERYAIMRDYMPTKGNLGLDMMTRTCTVQANLDYTSEKDMVQKMRVAMALQPLVTALFASSPFLEGKPTGFQSYRAHVWQDTDPDRCGLLPFVFDDSFGFERYVDYLLTVPMYFLYRDGKYINCAGQKFLDHIHEANLQDWADHTTVAFPETRLKHFLEMRGADVGSLDMMIA
ncbi:MAG: glutamate-cysteine ligase family protein, partial [Alphaproteobacteria bacterium]